MNELDSSLTLRLPACFKKELRDYAKTRDLTVSQLVRQHFSAELGSTRRSSAATETAGRRYTPRKLRAKERGEA